MATELQHTTSDAQGVTDEDTSTSTAGQAEDPLEAAAMSNARGAALQEAEWARQEEETPLYAPVSYAYQPQTLIPHKPQECEKRLCVVLDLDETLVRFREGPVHWRPHFEEFMDEIKHVCEVVLWTASTRKCAARIMDELDPVGDRLHHHVYRNDLWFQGVPYTKDLRLLNRPMDRVLIIENTPQCVFNNPQNAVIVEDYIDPDETDRHLHLVKDLILAMVEEEELNVPEHLHSSALVDNVAGSDADGTPMTFHLPSYVSCPAAKAGALTHTRTHTHTCTVPQGPPSRHVLRCARKQGAVDGGTKHLIHSR